MRGGGAALMKRRRYPLRTGLALRAGRVARAASRAAGFGGSVLSGRVALALDPGCLATLSRGIRIALVTGTNGKTTTTAFLATALRQRGPVAHNHTGANMLDGLVSALAEQATGGQATGGTRCHLAALEVDELHLPAAMAATRPAVVLLLNISRDQLDRVGEPQLIADRFAAALRGHPDTVVVANCDDPLVVGAALAAGSPRWVAAGTRWRGDAARCPHCGGALRETATDGWECTGCTLRRPTPLWRLDGGWLRGPGTALRLDVTLPGRANQVNAAMAIAAAAEFGIPARQSRLAIAGVGQVAGRYRWIRFGAHQLRIVLAKNPASWAEALEVVTASSAPIVISVNAREADGTDTSWLYDVPFEALRGRSVVVTGERRGDLAVRLAYAEIDAAVRPELRRALALLPPGPVELMADYTSFHQLQHRLGARYPAAGEPPPPRDAPALRPIP